MRPLLRAVFPGGLVLLLALVFLLNAQPEKVGNFADQYRWLAYGAGLLLAVLFHRSRVFVALIALASADVVYRGASGDPAILVAAGSSFVALIGLLAFVRDRGPFSSAGLLQLGGAALFSAVALLLFSRPETLAAFATVRLQPEWLFGGFGVPPAAVLVGAVALLPAAYAVARWRGPADHSLVWAQLILLLAMNPIWGRSGSALLLVASGVVLGLSVLETSYAMAYRDELTGLPGRRSLIRDLDGLSGTYTLAMVDVDHFKKFNDKHGHEVGDQVLRMVAACLARAPGGAKAYRYGGEEFTMLFRGRRRDEALPHLDALRASVEAARFTLRSWNRPRAKPEGKRTAPAKGAAKKAKKLAVTVSLGVADSTGDQADSGTVLKKADKALYRAKKKGRNQTSK